jgi:hypothetical protein
MAVTLSWNTSFLWCLWLHRSKSSANIFNPDIKNWSDRNTFVGYIRRSFRTLHLYQMLVSWSWIKMFPIKIMHKYECFMQIRGAWSPVKVRVSLAEMLLQIPRPTNCKVYFMWPTLICSCTYSYEGNKSQSGIAWFEIPVELIRTSLRTSQCNSCRNMMHKLLHAAKLPSHHKHETDTALLVQQTLELTPKTLNIQVIS